MYVIMDKLRLLSERSKTAVTLTDLTGGTKYDIAVRAYSGSTWTAYTSADIAKATIKS